ncbi:MAG: S9 family peptidase [Myxococcales bacterium]|nr:S9 family peptidase [Myxococcales bacterium]
MIDPYRWMEDVASSELSAWVTGQNAHTRATLDGVRVRGELLARITTLAATRDEVKNAQRRMNRLFYLKRPASEDTFKLYLRDGVGPERLLVDPKATTTAATASIDFYEPSPTGRHLAFGVSANGSEDSVLHVVDVNTGALLADTIDRTRHGEPRWLPDGASFFYRRSPTMAPGAASSTKYQRSRDYLHVLGSDPAADIAVFGYDVSARAPLAAADSPYVYLWPGCPYVLGVAQHGTSNDLTIYVAPLASVDGARTPWTKLAGPEDQVLDFAVHGKDVFLLTHRGAVRAKVIRTSLASPDLAHAETIIASSDVVVSELAAAQDALYVRTLDDGLGRVIRVPFDGTAPRSLALPFDATVADFAASPTLPGFSCHLQSWTRPKVYYAYDPSTERFRDLGILQPAPPQPTVLESVEVKARSKDGTMVPLSLVYRRGIDRTRPHPTLLVGYGSYGVSLSPSFDARRLAWLERGGIYAVAHVRGGGEYGEEWHLAGMKQNKQNTIDDLIACAERLIALGYTSSAHLAGEGTSAGAIAIAGAITQRPALFAAALVRVGITDALRFETTALGPQNAQELGSSAVPEEVEPLYRMSAYYHVVEQTRYPAILLTGAAHDARVPVWQPAKMAARLQAATSSRKPILFRLDSGSGHGYGFGTTSSQLNEELADGYAFLLWQLAPAPPAPAVRH